MEYLIDSYWEKTRRNITGNNKAIQKLRREAERAKRRLSHEHTVRLEIDSFYQGEDYRETLTRRKFEQLNMDLFKSTINTIMKVLSESHLKKEDIDEIVFAGGSTRIPKIQELVKEFFNGKEPAHGINPDEVIAYGAAIQAAVLSKRHNTDQLVLLADVNPLSLGLEGSKGNMVTMIRENTPIPCNWMTAFSTAKDDQTGVTIQVYEGEKPIAKDNRLLGIFQFDGIPPEPSGFPLIDVSFQIDVNGILKVTAQHRKTGIKDSMTFTNIHNRFSRKDVERMTKVAKRLAREDQKRKVRSEVRNDLESYVYSLKNVKQKISDKLSKKEKEKIESAIEDKIKWLDLNEDAETEEIRYKREDLEYVMQTIMLRLYSASGHHSDPSADYDVTKDEL